MIDSKPKSSGDDEDAWLKEQKSRVAIERIAALHKLYINQKNPLYAWHAMLRAFADNQPLPEWCINYLRNCSISIYDLTTRVVGHDFQQEVRATHPSDRRDLLDPAAAMSALPAALDFPGRGKNSFSELRRDVSQHEDAMLQGMGESELWNISPSEAEARIKARRGVEHTRSVRRRVKKGKKIL